MYLSWRNLREDYKEKELISYAWLSILAFMVGGRLVSVLGWGGENGGWQDWLSFWAKPGFSYIGGYLAMVLVGWWSCRKNSWKTWAFFEDNLVAVSIMFLLFLLDEFVRSGFDINAAMAVVAVFDGLAIGVWSKGRYRSFVWYRSGKKGFAFWTGNLVTWLTMLGFSFLVVENTINRICYLTLGLISAVGLVILGDVLTISRKKK